MKKRVEFIARFTEFFPHEGDHVLSFNGGDDHLLELFREDDSVFAELFPNVQRLSLRGAQLIGRLDWLYLDFQQQDYLHRIGVFVEALDHSELARDFTKLTDGSSVRFSHIQIKANPNKISEQDVAPQSATRAESKPEGGDKPQTESEERSR